MSYTTKVLLFLCTTLLPALSLAQNCNQNIPSTTPTPMDPPFVSSDDIAHSRTYIPTPINNRFRTEGKSVATTKMELTKLELQRYGNGNNLTVPDGTLLDKKTGLLWKKCSEGKTMSTCSGLARYTRKQALEQAQSANNAKFAGYRDWRVPTIRELASITERQCIAPAINLSLFPNTPSDVYWTSEPYTSRAWYYNFIYGYADYSLSQNDLYNVRLVRGPY